MKRHLRFAILSFDPQNNTLVQNIVNSLAPKYGYVEGRDYVNFGYKPSSVFSQTVQAMATNVPGALKKDRHGNPLVGMPAMKGINSIQDMGAVVEVTPSATAETWLGLGGLRQGPKPVPFLLATTAVGAPTYYPYLDSGQIAGMLTGVKGAGDYEFLLGTSANGTRATGRFVAGVRADYWADCTRQHRLLRWSGRRAEGSSMTPQTRLPAPHL